MSGGSSTSTYPVLVTGSREGIPSSIVDFYLSHVFKDFIERRSSGPSELPSDLPESANTLDNSVQLTTSYVVHGGAVGVDTHASNWAKKNDIKEVVYKPDYSLGRRAPLIRNKEMIDVESPYLVLAFHNGHSKGTLFTANYAKKKGLKVYMIVYSNGEVSMSEF